MHPAPVSLLLFLLGAALAACSPTLDWRELRPEGQALQLMLPCKPNSMTRSLPLAGAPVRLTLYACSAGGQTWALAVADVAEPQRVGPALVALRAAAAANLAPAAAVGAAASASAATATAATAAAAAEAATALPFSVPGATPNPAAGRSAFSGRLADGQVVQEQVAVFAHGTVVYQATVLGAQLPADAVATFFESLRLGR